MTIPFAARRFALEIRAWAIPALLVFAAKSTLAEMNYVPSGSMNPTILAGDLVFVNKLAYGLRVPFTTLSVARWADPSRGDIVVGFEPGTGLRIVKRVIGVPGDVVEVKNEALWVNGHPVQYTALAPAASRDLPPGLRGEAVFAQELLGRRAHAVMALPGVQSPVRTFGPVRVAPGQFFLMGDNRDNSEDSRYFGTVARNQIVGSATAVVLSADLSRHLSPRFDRFFSRLE